MTVKDQLKILDNKIRQNQGVIMICIDFRFHDAKMSRFQL